jgi:tellurite resistance protein
MRISSYPCVIVGLPYEGRAEYVRRNVREGSEVTLHLEPDNPHDSDAVACFHGRQCIGYIPSEKSWVRRSIREGDTHRITVTGFDTNDDGELSCVEIDVTVLTEGNPRAEFTPVRSIVSEIGDELRILAMVATADGRIQAPERELIEKFAEIRAVEVGLTPGEGEAAHALRWARRKIPTKVDAGRIIGAFSVDRPKSLEILWEVIEIVAEMDGALKSSENAAVSHLRELIAVAQGLDPNI